MKNFFRHYSQVKTEIDRERAAFGHSLNPERNLFPATAPKRFFWRLWPLPGLLRAILSWVSSQIFGFFSFSVLLGISFVLETNSLVIVNPKNDRIVFRPSIHLPAETAGICRYGRYFFWYEIGGVPVSVH